MKIGKQIQQLRREKNLTQEQMAAALGVTSAAVSKWETNAAMPDVAMLCPLARLLGTTVDRLLDFRPALEAEEINALLEGSRRLFEQKRAVEAVEACEALLREYPDDLYLKMGTAGLYTMYLTAVLDTEWTQRQVRRTIELLEQCRESTDQAQAAQASYMLVSLYTMQGELDKALEEVEKLPKTQFDAQKVKASILLRQGKIEEAEKLYQAGLWTAVQDVSVNLIGLHHVAQRRGDNGAALEWLDRARAVERVLGLDELCSMGPLRLLRAEILCREGRMDEAMEELTCYVEQNVSRWAKFNRGDAIKSALYDKLDLHASGMSAAYLAQNLRTVLEQNEASEELKEREDFQKLLERLEEIENA